ncbi:phosphotransferase family protein [Sorangium sp. So ce128]|uniref:phosphotransferase family protein n=1 Tax=Sorangium sp. So ce128 TaxID=3133281 RepID=UPI003F5FCCA6
MGNIQHLEAASVEGWLVRHGLLRPRGDVRVTLLSGRAFAALVETEGDRPLFLKQPFAAIPPVGARREGMLLRFVSQREDLEGLRHVLANFVVYDEPDNVTVTAGLPLHRTIHSLGVPPADPLLRATAGRLATMHTVSAAAELTDEERATYQAINPVPSYDRITPDDLASAPGNGFVLLLAVMQALSEPLGAARAGWRPACLIHGDFRDDNILIDPAAGGDPSPVFIDWEMGGWGDPLWDLGALIGQLLYYWVESIRAEQGSDFASWVRGASIPFHRVQHAIQVVLESYAEASGRTLSGPEGFIDRCVQLAGVFLLHRVLGSLESIGGIHPAAFYSLHLGRTLVGQPRHAGRIIAKGLL